MKVAVYHPWVYLKGGAERTLLELMRRSRHEWTLFTNRFESEGTFPEFQDLPVVELSRVSVRRNIWTVGHAGLCLLTQSLPLADTSALLISSEGLGNLVPLRPRGVPIFSFCHTPLKIAYDPFTRHRYLTHQHPSALTRAAIASYLQIDRLGWRQYRRVFCNSREVASRVIRAGLTAPDRVEVIHPGVDLSRFDPDGPHQPFFLLAGRIARTKNIELAVDAFVALKRRRPALADVRLVIAGMVDQKSRPYFQFLLERAQSCADIEFVVDPSDDELVDLYRRCYATLMTSLNEDWGIVVLEGMASAKPVLAVERGGPTESVIHGLTGLLLPATTDAFCDAMEWLLADDARAAEMGEAARKRAALFRWDGFIQRIDDYVEALAAHPERDSERLQPVGSAGIG
jgi:glycosyltransferase involved in cell wall biosynthesis